MAKKEAALDGTEAVVTGGSRGRALGVAVARARTQAGSSVIVTGRNRPALDDQSNRGGRRPCATPLGRIARPEELGPPAVFLAGRGSDFTTGQVVGIDGGIQRS